MLGPGAAQQVAAAAEEAAQQAEAAANTAAIRVMLEQPAGIIIRRQLSTNPNASGGISRAGSCQLFEDKSPAPVLATAPNATEAQETILELSKALTHPSLGNLKTQSSGNLASKAQMIDCTLATPDMEHAEKRPVLPNAEEEQWKLSAGNDTALAQTSADPPEDAPVPGHKLTGGPSLALFKPTPHRQVQQSSQAALTRLQMFTKPIGAHDTEGLLPRGSAAATMTHSASCLPRLTSPFAKTAAVGRFHPTDALQTHPATGALKGEEPVWHPDQADEESKRIRAYRGADTAQHQAGAEHMTGRWTVASGEDGWAAVPCMPTKHAFLKASEVEHMWQQFGREDATALHSPHEGGQIKGPQSGREGRHLWEPDSPAPAAFQPWGSHCVLAPVHAGSSAKEQPNAAAVPDHQKFSFAIGQPVAGSGILSSLQMPQLQPSAPNSGALTACSVHPHTGICASAVTMPSHQNNFANPSSPRVLSSQARGCAPQSPIEAVRKLIPQSPTEIV